MFYDVSHFVSELKYNVAIKYLKEVLAIEHEMFTSSTQKQDMAQTFINLCSIYSEMGKHDIALTYIEQAVQILEKEYEARYPSRMGNAQEKQKFTSIVASAFHNAAVEYEFTGDFSSCLIYYQKALKLGQMFLGPNHPLTTTFELNFEAAKKKINKIPTNLRKKISFKNKVQVHFVN